MKNKTRDEIFMNIAYEIASLSNCVSMQVGAVIVKDCRIVSMGYNGSPAGYTNCNDVFTERGPKHTAWSNKYEIHAELNAILFAAKNGIAIDGATIYCTHQPCRECSKNLIQSGIKKIIYKTEYYRLNKLDTGEIKEFMKKNMVTYIQIDNKEIK